MIILNGFTFVHGQPFFSSVLSPEMDSILNQYIDNTPNGYSTIQMTFMEYGGVDFLRLSNSNGYDSRFIDGYFIKRNKLIVFYSYNKKDWGHFINYSAVLNYKDSISSYNDNAPREDGRVIISINERPHSILYQLRSPHEIVEVNSVKSCPEIKWEEANDTNAIKSRKLNRIINDYINNNYSMLYVIRFNKIDDNYYVSINGSFAYDRNETDAFFFRNGHLIVLYDMQMIPDYDFIAKKDIIKYEKNIDNYRGAILYPEFKNLPTPQKYKIVSRNKIKKVSLRNKEWILI